MKPYLKRSISKMSLEKALHISDDIFIKPSDKVKLFTGMVLSKDMPLEKRRLLLGDVDEQTSVYVCEALSEFTSEFRCFFENGELVGCKPYTDNFKEYPSNKDFSMIEAAGLSLHKEIGYSAFTMDWGFSDGNLILIESNDMWAIGSYGLNEVIYTDLIVARFKQILSNK